MNSRSRRWLRRLAYALAIPIALAVVGGVGWWWVHDYAWTADGAKFVYEDLDRFERAYAALTPDSDSVTTLAPYFERATRGLTRYADIYDLDAASLAAAIGRWPDYYAALTELPSRVRAREPAIREAFRRLERLYPRAIFPPVYYLVGARRAGGTVGGAGVLIGTELYGLPASTAPDAFGDVPRPTHTTDDLPHLVVHELVHFNQTTASPIGYATRWNNLARAVKEGAADFLTELASGGHINQDAHAYGMANERQLWREFRQVADSNDTGEWFFAQPEDERRPRDLGYFLGYRIVESFYRGNADKRSAIRRIIDVDDYEAFLLASEYDP